MARGGGAELGKAVPTPWRAISACPWSIFDTGAASPDGDGADWRRQWSPDGDGDGGDACPDGGGGGGGYAAALFVAARGRCCPTLVVAAAESNTEGEGLRFSEAPTNRGEGT
jgi:hypothetical protein